MIFEILMFWLRNGKTTTALITGIVTVAMAVLLKQYPDMAPYVPDMTELVTALIAEGTLGIIGVFHKIVKMFQDKRAEKGNNTVIQ